MDLYRSVTTGRRPVFIAAAAAALGTGYYFYTYRVNQLHSALPIATKAVVVLRPEGDSKVTGSIIFEQIAQGVPVTITGDVRGLPPNAKRGFHVHQWGDLADGCTSAGPHFNPHEKTHGAPSDTARHVGDLGNIQSDDEGAARFSFRDGAISLSGISNVIGRAVVVHAGTDDLGRGGNEESLKTGNAGARIACGVIGLAQTK
ncbi:hypothetical protein P691DRAFT_755999 [Macrolepiota fuliginosa MF-IS2]|uniref:Superoxide dismutase [Cu-Zn] n=1 Tax=Macrolepiota fuliginosa MF-IS2 TaxID=1400762 RepID=A0A9P6C5J7_9AGAR|nr:hypothetical protein P691DRAFT_755999 [Macrolepiota fuliginosa MF-IS2]